MSGHRLGKEKVGLNGAVGLFLSICASDTTWLPGNPSVALFSLFTFILSCFLLGFLRAFLANPQLPLSFVCVIDINPLPSFHLYAGGTKVSLGF